MAKKVSNHTINNAQTDWSRDESNNGWPYSGQSIQEYIRRRLADLESGGKIDSKFGASHFDTTSNTIYFFKDDADRAAWLEDESLENLIVDSFVLNTNSNVTYQVATTLITPLQMNISADAESAEISIGFVVQRTVTGDSWINTGHYITAEVQVINPSGNVVTVPIANNMFYPNGGPFTVDVRDYLTTGNNQVNITLTAPKVNEFTVLNYNITLSEISISLIDDSWKYALVQSQDYYLGGFKITGDLFKYLNIEIRKGNNLLAYYTGPSEGPNASDSPAIEIGPGAYPSGTGYRFNKQNGFNLGNWGLTTGVYEVTAYLTSANFESPKIVYNIMYVAAGDENTAQLVCMNDKASIVDNYSLNTFCNYSLYDSGASQARPHIKLSYILNSTPDVAYEQTVTKNTNEAIKFDYDVRWQKDSQNIYATLDISLGNSIQTMSVPINNAKIYPAESLNLDFYLNPITRTNGTEDKEIIYNDATYPQTELEPSWTKMAWVDGIDGWTTDENERRCLLIPARSSVSIPYRVFSQENISFEMCFKVSNVSDYDENVITIAENPTTAGFTGIRIKPTNITVHSVADNDASKDTERGVNFEDEKIIHLIVTVAVTNKDKNLVTGYINGCVAFQFDYTPGTSWLTAAPIIIGSLTSDVYIYFIRVYKDFVLDKLGVEKNYINSLPDLQARQSTHDDFYSIVSEGSHSILYENILKSRKNFFVVEMLGDNTTIPSLAEGWSSSVTGRSNFEMHFGEHPEWDFKIFDVETGGQGTTSMTYYRWNLRFRIDKNNPGKSKARDVSYYDAIEYGQDGTRIFHIQDPQARTSVYFDGGANNTPQNHPAIKRITAKINFASSMQSHKMGATAAYNDIRDAMDIQNDAQSYAESNDLPMPTVAVYQYPAYGFVKKLIVAPDVYSYTYIGLFTIGPDKGDKSTFGYDINSDIKNSLVTLEGPDHDGLLTRFAYPWIWNKDGDNIVSNDRVRCVRDTARESNYLCIVTDTDVLKSWEIGDCYGIDDEDVDAITTKLKDEFLPAYAVVYDNSTLIKGIPLNTYGATAAATLEYINNNIDTFQNTTFNSRFTMGDAEFWIDGEYILYHYDPVTRQYVAGTNLYSTLGNPVGENVEEQNEWFKQQRRNRFRVQAEDYWSIPDAIYHFLFILIFGATDNFAKNSYPYKLSNLNSGGRWMWRQDDLDTIFDIDNTGGQTKPYDIEFTDDKSGTAYFAGSSSVFWNLIYETFWENYLDKNNTQRKGIASMGREFLLAMISLGTGGGSFSSCVGFFRKYFWNKAQSYFGQAAYNVDAVFKYETAWDAQLAGQYGGVDPLKQSLGDHYSAEMLWVTRRLLYMFGLFKVGAFSEYNNEELGRIALRLSYSPRFMVRPILSMYPSFIVGQGNSLPTARTLAGTTHEFSFDGVNFGNNTEFTLQATNYLTEIQNFKDLQQGTGSGAEQTVQLYGAKLRNFKIGWPTYSHEENGSTVIDVNTNIPSIAFPNNRCLETIDARNAITLKNSVSLESCKRLISADFTGTSITQVTLPSGSKIESLALPDSITAIRFRNLKFLAPNNLTLPSDLHKITTIQVENCSLIDGFSLLRQLYNSNNSALRSIRVIWEDIKDAEVYDLSMLANIAGGKDKNGNDVDVPYSGMSADGNTFGTPIIEGTLNLITGMYTNDLNVIGVREESIEDWGDQGYKRAKTETFGTLYIIYDPNRIYISFEDSEVESIFMAQPDWSSDGIGITMTDADRITANYTNAFSAVLRENTTITKCNEFKYFNFTRIPSSTNSGSNSRGAFSLCTNLEEVTLPRTLKSTGDGSFVNDTSLVRVDGECELTSVGQYSFSGCTSLTYLPDLSHVTAIGREAFRNCSSLTGALSLPSLTTNLDGSTFMGCSSLTSIASLGSIASIRDGSGNSGEFRGCSGLISVTLPSTLTYVGSYAFAQCSNLETVNFSNATCTVGQAAFEGLSKLSTITNYSNITGVSRYAFNNSGLAGTLNLPSLVGISQSAFKSTKITSITSLGNITTIANDDAGSGTFQNCTLLETVVLPEGLIKIGRMSFGYCTSLSSINIPESVEQISTEAFYNDSLLEMELPQVNSITSIGSQAFENTKINGRLNLPNLEGTLGGSAFKATKITSILSLGSIVNIGNENTSQGAFQNCSELVSAVLPNTLVSIGRDTFRNCTSLEQITIPTSVTLIRLSAFRDSSINCTVNLPNLVTLQNEAFQNTKITAIESLGTITTIAGDNGSATFRGCTALTTANIPSTVTAINREAFYGCSSLETVTIANNSALTLIGREAFRGCPNLVSINLPTTLVTIGSMAFENSKISGIINLPNLEVLSVRAFYNTKITSITSLGRVATLQEDGGYGVFDGCTELTSVVLPDSLLTLGSRTFRGCSALTSINIPQYITTLGSEVFIGCNSLIIDEINLPNLVSTGHRTFYSGAKIRKVKSLGSITGLPDDSGTGYFQGQTLLTECILPSTLTSTGYRAFKGCTALTSITIPENVTIVNIESFMNCTALETVTIQATGLTTIYNDSFAGCKELKTINLPASITSIGNNNFYQSDTTVSYSLLSLVNGLNLPNLTTTGSLCFCNSKLTGTVNVPALVNVGEGTFSGSLISSITIGAAGGTLCNSCPNLSNIVVLGGTAIGRYAFTNLRQSSIYVDLPSTITELNGGIVYNSSYSAGSTLTLVIRATTPPTLRNGSLSGANSRVIYVPNGCGDTYKAAWTSFANEIFELDANGQIPS